MDQRTSGGDNRQPATETRLTLDKLFEYCAAKGIVLSIPNGRLRYDGPQAAVTPALLTVLKARQIEIAARLGKPLGAPKPKGVLDEAWIKKANQWWKENVRCWVGLWPQSLAQPPYILADTLGLIDLKEMSDE